MTVQNEQVTLAGGCFWCLEAVKVAKVRQKHLERLKR